MKDNIISLGSFRSNKTGSAGDWSPEEAVTYALSTLQAGGEYENAALAVTIVVFPDEDGDPGIVFYSSSPNAVAIVGAMELAKNMVMNPE